MSTRISLYWFLLLGSLCAAVPAQADVPPSGAATTAAAGKPYTITVAKVAAKKGQPATATVLIRPAAGYHVNKDFPTSLKLKLPAGVTAQKSEMNKADAQLSEQQGSFQVVLTSAEAGKKTVPGDLKFAVCTDTTCDPQKSPVSIEMEVK